MFSLSKEKSTSLYYEYMNTFSKNCILSKEKLTEFCSKNTLEKLGYSQNYLDKCRELRIPYIFVKNDIPDNFDINNIILPITNLEEEREKGPFASSFARHFNCPITIYQPNDYGSKAATNIEAMKVLFNSFNLTHTTLKGKKNSSGIEFEAGLLNRENANNILIISASRDYGLDDIIFGPKERKIIKNTNIPTMLINPRGDLYALCD
jgi:hypothetical protein